MRVRPLPPPCATRRRAKSIPGKEVYGRDGRAGRLGRAERESPREAFSDGISYVLPRATGKTGEEKREWDGAVSGGPDKLVSGFCVRHSHANRRQAGGRPDSVTSCALAMAALAYPDNKLSGHPNSMLLSKSKSDRE